jgi:hypothetical protein
MALLSLPSIDTAAIRTFRRSSGRTARRTCRGTATDLARFRLSSVALGRSRPGGRRPLHLLASHPTPPVLDGDEDRNGRRNFDEVRFWVRYLDSSPAIRDDRGTAGGFPSARPFVILGDLNAPPEQAESSYDGVPAIAQLLRDRRLQDPPQLTGRPTASFRGGTRVDYVAERGAPVLGGAWWPDSVTDAGAAWRRWRRITGWWIDLVAAASAIAPVELEYRCRSDAVTGPSERCGANRSGESRQGLGSTQKGHDASLARPAGPLSFPLFVLYRPASRPGGILNASD